MAFNPKYNATPETVGEGQRSTGTIDSTGRLRVDGGLGSIDSAGNPINPDAYAHVLTYNVDNTLATDSFTNDTNTWTQTFTYTTGLVTGISKWVKS